jgi:8-oxo-dGTP diphosphatase
MKHLTVTAAILIHKGEILCMQRKASERDYISLKYEFPGGKAEAGETMEDALSRELKEELNLDLRVKPNHYYMTVNHTYPDFSITMYCYKCEITNRTIECNDHHHYVWLRPKQLDTLDWASADWPVVKRLMGSIS